MLNFHLFTISFKPLFKRTMEGAFMRRHVRWYSLGVFCLLFCTFSLALIVQAQATSAITGKVIGDGGVPLENVQVVAYHPVNWTGIIFWEVTAQSMTDANGEYQITELMSDTYRIGFFPPTDPRDYFEQYYSGATDVDSATNISVPTGTTVPNINAQLSSGAHIKGKVTGPTGENLSGIRVGIYSQGTYKSVTTKNNGTYDAGGLEAGSYTVQFEDPTTPPQYATERFNNKRGEEEPTEVTLTTGQIRNNINAQLDRLAVIQGRVTDEGGAPLAEITVVGQRLSDYPPFPSFYDDTYSSTDANGYYTMTGLYADSWRVQFVDNRYGRYSAEWYDDTYEPSAATLLTITYNMTTTNINAQLAERGAITGVVTNESGTPLENITVRAEFQDAENSQRWHSANEVQTDSNGHYNLCCLNPQSYRVSFGDPQMTYITEYYDNVLYPDVFGPETVTMVQVSATVTTTQINAQLSTYSRIVGRITDKLGHPAAQIAVSMLRYDLTAGGSWNDINTAYTDANGYYGGQVLPGRYRLYFSDLRSAPNYYINEYYDNAPDLESATDITITGQSTITINATLAAKARITGTVTDSSGNPAVGIRVSLYEETEFNGWLSNFSVETDNNGNYVIGGLSSGAYRVGFSDERGNRLYNNEFYNDRATVQEADDIIVPTDEAIVPGINAQLAKLSTLQGQVTNENGDPLALIIVTAQRYLDLGEGAHYWESAGYAETDAMGQYEITGLYAGLYRLRFQDYNGNYQDEWYDNRGYELVATTFSLDVETTLTGHNAQLANEPFTWPPLAQPDETSVNEGDSINHVFEGSSSVLNNDLNDSEGILQAATITQPAHGQLTLNPDGTFTYTHDGSESPSDFFTYRANDGVKQSNIATVTITILPVNDPPVAADDAATVLRGGTITALNGGATSVLANDSDAEGTPLTAAVVTNPQHGTLTLNGDGTFSYTHNGDSATSDSFTYRAVDGLSTADTATVTITIIDEAPLTFSKTVSIEGIKPRCTAPDEIKAPVGTTIIYCYTVRNNGAQPATNHTLVDSHLGQLLTNHAHTVAPGATYSTTFTQTLTVTTTNVATWTASMAPTTAVAQSPQVISAQKSATVHISGPTDDSDQDTIPDNLEKAGDIDQDNIPNFLDTDADGDGVGDRLEAGASPLQPQDSDNDGIPDYLDATIQTGGSRQLYLPLIHR